MAKTPAVFKKLDTILAADSPDMNALWEQIQKAHDKHPDLYKAWLPSFYASSVHGARALARLDSIEAFDAAQKVIPEGLFYLRLGSYGSRNFTTTILKKSLSSKRAKYIHGLELSNHSKMSDKMFSMIADTTHFDALVSLAFDSLPTLSAANLEELFAAPCTSALEELDISHSLSLGDEGLDAILEAPHADSLKTLRLTATKITDASLQKLATTSKLPSLTSLDITRNQFSPESVVALLESPFAARLDTFKIDWSAVGDEGARAIANSPHLTNLKWLTLKNAMLSIDGVRALLVSKNLPALKLLSVWGNNNTYTKEELAAAKEEFADRVELI